MSEDEYYLRFSYCPGIGPQRFQSLLKYFKSAKNAWVGNRKDYERCGIGFKTYSNFDQFRSSFEKNKSKVLSELDSKNIVFLSQIDKLFPKQLLKLTNPPIGIFAKGNTRLLNDWFLFSVVGSRKCTQYGRQVTERFVKELVDAQVCVVSGLALGIDSIAHETAISNKGKTIAVMGNGVDISYPQENSNLYKNIIGTSNLIISEYPPGTWPNKGSFPARNRIIAALSRGLLITEAARSSGSLITAELANQLNVPVFAIPGPITSPQSQGTLFLLQKYAKMVVNPDEIFDVFQLKSKRIVSQKKLTGKDLSSSAKLLLNLIRQEPVSINTLSKSSRLEISEVIRIISMLEIKGLVKSDGQGNYVAEV